MQTASHNLLVLVRSALWGVPAEGLSPQVDWKKVFILAKQHTLVGLLAGAVQMLPEDSRPDKTILTNLQTYCMKNIQAHMLITRNLARVMELLRSADIEPVLFKGHGLALNYPDPLSRQCGDIDLYIGKKNYDKAVKCFISNFGLGGEHDSENVKHYHCSCNGVSVELHRIAEILPGVFRNRRYQKWTVENLAPSNFRLVDIEGVMVNLPPYNFDAVYVLNHAWHHFVNGGIGLRQLCDWTLYLHRFHSMLDYDKLKKDLKSFGLLRVWHIFAWIAVNRLGLQASECPLYEEKCGKAADKVLEIVLHDGNFGFYSERGSSKRPEGYSTGKIHSMLVTTKRYFRITHVYPTHILKAWVAYFCLGVYHYFKGLF